MLFFVFSFLRDHVCKNSTCDGFSLLKCKDCKRAHYYSVECQWKDWEKHQNLCEKLMHQDCWDECEKFLEILICRKPVSFKIFTKTLQQRLFEFFYGALHNKIFTKTLQQRLFEFFHGALQNKFFLQNQHFVDYFSQMYKMKINSNISSLLKRPNASISWYTLRNQFEEVYGQKNSLMANRVKI